MRRRLSIVPVERKFRTIVSSKKYENIREKNGTKYGTSLDEAVENVLLHIGNQHKYSERNLDREAGYDSSFIDTRFRILN